MSSPRIGVGDHGADGHAQHDVLGAAAVLVGAAAVLAALGAMDARIAVVDQRVDVAVGDRVDAAAAAAVAAVGSAARNVFLAAERGDAVAAVAGDDLDRRFVEEFHGAVPHDRARSARCRRRAAPPLHYGVQPGGDTGSPSSRPYCTSRALQSCVGLHFLAHRRDAREVVEERALRLAQVAACHAACPAEARARALSTVQR